MLLLNVLIVLLLMIVNGLFAMSEMAVVSSRRARLQQLVNNGRRGARTAQDLVEDPNRFLSTVQIGITLVGVLAGAFSGATLSAPLAEWLDRFPLFGGRGHAIALGIVVVIVTYLTLIVGELVPKRIALKNPERVAVLVARPMRLLSRIAAPAAWFLDISSAAVLRLLRLHGEREDAVTEEEVRSMISEGTREGVFDPREQRMIEGVLRLDDRSARSAMVPRPDVQWLDVKDDLATIRRKIEGSGHSRFLVCRNEVDEVLGVVRTRDILDRVMAGEPVDLAQIMSEPIVLLDTTPMIKVLDRFKTSGVHMGIVVDEYGSLEGIITITRVMEIIAGDLSELGQRNGDQAFQREDGSWLMDGMMTIDDFAHALELGGLEYSAHYHTVAGLVLHCLERVPSTGDSVLWKDFRLEVVDMDGNRVDKVLVTPPAGESEEENETRGADA